MKLIRITNLVAATAALTAAASAETVWVGTAFVLPTPPAICGSAAQNGDYVTLTYRPAGAPLGNGADSYLAYVGPRSHFTMLTPGNTFRAGINYSGARVNSFINFGSNVGGITAWSMTPGVLSTATPHVFITATFANFYGVTGCTVSLRAALERVP